MPPRQQSGRRPWLASRVARLTAFFFVAAAAVGLAVTAYGLLEIGLAVDAPSLAVLAVVPVVALATCANLLLRFVRWQYLLRRLEVRLPALPSLGGFAGSFAFLPIPLYLGQMVARTRLGLRPGVQQSVGLFVFLWERTLDLWVLSFLALAALRPALAIVAAGSVAALLLPSSRRLVLRGLAAVTDSLLPVISSEAELLPPEAPARVAGSTIFIVGAVLSLLAWFVACVAVLPLVWAAGIEVDATAGTGSAASSILAGAFSLIPLGAATSGTALFHDLERLGAPAGAAALVVLIYRGATLWLTVAIGATALVLHYLRTRQPAASDHFDRIDECYDTWLPPHIRAHVVGKKVAAMRSRIAAPGRGLDIGCGRGWYMRQLGGGGIEIVGIDLSARQMAASRAFLGAGASLAQASVTDLPFAAGSFDFAYVINVLHHLPTPADQIAALGQIATVIRPGGVVFVHEMNVANPLFRFYLAYVFPILKGIEEGTEPYMDARALPEIPELALESIEYFTFAPDFLPPRLLAAAAPIERWLERSPLRRHAAHFMAVLRRRP